MATDFQLSIKQLQLESRKKYPAIDKVCEQLLKSELVSSSDVDLLQSLLDLIPATKSKKLANCGLKLIEWIVLLKLKVTRIVRKVEMTSLMAYFDSISKIEDEELTLKVIQVLPKLFGVYSISDVHFQKFYSYFARFRASKNVNVVETCKNSIFHLLRVYFFQRDQDHRFVMSHLLAELTPKATDTKGDRILNNQIIAAILRLEMMLQKDFLERLVDIFLSNFPFSERQHDLLAAISIVRVHPLLRNIQKIIEAIIKGIQDFSDQPFLSEIIICIKNNWFKDFGMMDVIYRGSRQTIQQILLVFECLQKTLAGWNDKNKQSRNINPPQIILQICDLLSAIRQELFNYTNVKQYLENMKILKPLSEQNVEQLTLNFLNYFLNCFAQRLAKLLAFVSKWCDFKTLKRVVQELDSWIILCGIFQLSKAMNAFFRSLAYTCLPRKNNTVSDKNLKALQVLLDLMHRRVYIMDIESITLIFKVIQAIEKYFLIDQSTVTRDQITNYTEMEEEILNQYRIVREVFRNLLENTNELNPKQLGVFLQALTQVAMDTFTKDSDANRPQPAYLSKEAHKISFDLKVFALKKVSKIAIRNIHRIEQFWNPVSNFLLIHINHKDNQLALQAVDVLFKILFELARHQVRSQRATDLTIVFVSISQMALTCSNESIACSICESMLKILECYQTFVQRNMKPILSSLQNLMSTGPLNKRLHSLIEKNLEICIRQLNDRESFEQAPKITSILKTYLGNQQEGVEQGGFQSWKLIGSLLNRACQFGQNKPEKLTEVESDSQTLPKSTCRIIRCRSAEKLVNVCSNWDSIFDELLGLLLQSFLKSNHTNRGNYLRVLSWTLMPNITNLPYLTIKNAIVPMLNKILTYLVDNSLVAGIPTDTPHFKPAIIASNGQGRNNWKSMLAHYVQDTYSKALEVVGFLYRQGNMKKFKCGESILQTLLVALNSCLTKRNGELLILLIPIFKKAVSEMHMLSQLVNCHMLVGNMRRLIETLDHQESRGLKNDEVRILEGLQCLIGCIIGVSQKASASEQLSLLELVDDISKIYDNNNMGCLSSEMLQPIGLLSKDNIRSFDQKRKPWKAGCKDLLGTQLQKYKFITYLQQRLVSSKSVQDLSSASSIQSFDDPIELYKTVLEIQPKMTEGLIVFLKQAVGLPLESPQEEEDFVLKVLPVLLAGKDRESDFYRGQLSYMVNLLYASHDRIRLIQATAQLCIIHPKIQLFQILARLMSKQLSSACELVENEQNQQADEKKRKFDNICTILDLMGEVKVGPEFSGSFKTPESLIIYNYELVLDCLKLNRSEINVKVAQVLRKVAASLLR